MAKLAKPWKLTEDEDFSSFKAWRHNMLYCLKQVPAYLKFIPIDPKAKISWNKYSSGDPNRGLQDDDGANGKTAQEKASDLQAMLLYISQWVPCFLANDIELNTTCIDDVWNIIRRYYNIEQSEVQFIKFSSIKREENERPETLYQRILSHIQDNLLKKDGKISHDGKKVENDEDISPTLERMAVLRWLELLDPDLPEYVVRMFENELQHKSLNIRPQTYQTTNFTFTCQHLIQYS